MLLLWKSYIMFHYEYSSDVAENLHEDLYMNILYVSNKHSKCVYYRRVQLLTMWSSAIIDLILCFCYMYSNPQPHAYDTPSIRVHMMGDAHNESNSRIFTSRFDQANDKWRCRVKQVCTAFRLKEFVMKLSEMYCKVG